MMQEKTKHVKQILEKSKQKKNHNHSKVSTLAFKRVLVDQPKYTQIHV